MSRTIALVDLRTVTDDELLQLAKDGFDVKAEVRRRGYEIADVTTFDGPEKDWRLVKRDDR